MNLVKCTYTVAPGDYHLLHATRWVDPESGYVYSKEDGSGQCNSGFHRAADGTFQSVPFDGRTPTLTPVQQEVTLSKSKCPIRSMYDDAEIREAYKLGLRAGAAKLSEGVAEEYVVSRQLFRFWCIELGLHVPKAQHKRNTEKALAKAAKKGARVLLIDIETAPILAYVWSLWKQNVGLNQINNEWYILSYCAKWLGEPEVIYQDIRDTPHDDSSLMQPLWDLLNEADIIIGQNGKAFDMPKIQARLIMAGHLPPRPYKVIDTMLMAKQQFRFTSNKLEWMTGETAGLTTERKSKHSKFPGFMLWAECLKGNPEAWDEMKEYNIPDVTSMEELYLKLRPWYVGHPNMAVYVDSDKIACPKCGSHDVVQDGFTFTQVGKYELYKCGNCGGFSRGRYTRNSTSVRKALLSN